jgi:uncharacterized protein (DUF4415 family)
MAKKSSLSSWPAKLVNVSAESIFQKPLAKKQQAVLTRISKRRKEGDESTVDYRDIPSLTDEQLAKAYRPRGKALISVRLDHDVLAWLKSFGELAIPAA